MLGVPEAIRKLAATPAEKRNHTQQKTLRDFFLLQSKHYKRVPSLHSMELSGFCIGLSGYGVFSGQFG